MHRPNEKYSFWKVKRVMKQKRISMRRNKTSIRGSSMKRLFEPCLSEKDKGKQQEALFKAQRWRSEDQYKQSSSVWLFQYEWQNTSQPLMMNIGLWRVISLLLFLVATIVSGKENAANLNSQIYHFWKILLQMATQDPLFWLNLVCSGPTLDQM